MAKRKRKSPQKAAPTTGNKQQKLTKGVSRGASARPAPGVTKAAKGRAVSGAKGVGGRPSKAAAVKPQRKKGPNTANSSSTKSQDISTDTQPSYASAGASLPCTEQAQSQPDAKPNGALHQLQQPAKETSSHCLNSKRDPLPPDGQSAEPQFASHHAVSLPEDSTAPVAHDPPATCHSFRILCARPQLQPGLKHATRFSQQAHTAALPVACFSALEAVQSKNLTGNPVETGRVDGTAAAAATKQSSHAHQHSAGGPSGPAQVTKQRKVARASAKQQQQQQRQQQQQQQQQVQQARASVADECLDCQGLRLLPEDVPLHSECMVRMQRSSAEPGQASRYMQRARLANDMAQARGENKAGAIGHVPARPYALLDVADESGPSNEAADLQMAREEYDKFDCCLRKLLWQRAVLLLGQEKADSALAERDNFVQVCLLGQRPGRHAGPPSVEQAAQACKQYHAMLQEVYGKDLILDPHVMSVDALKDHSTCDDLHQFRLLQRRFIVYKASKGASHRCPATPDESPHPSTCSPIGADDSSPVGKVEAAAAADPAATADASACDVDGGGDATAASNSSVYVDVVGHETSSDVDVPDQLPDWDDTLTVLWQTLQHKTTKLTCKQVQDNSEEPTAPSCTITDGSWQSGLCQGHNLADSDRVWAAIDDSLQNKAGSAHRLYFLDGTFPGQLPEGCSTHEDVPGLCCGVDQAVNRMLPAPMRSSRPTNLFKQLCVESTGTASFTMFAPIGRITNVTAFHQETKKRRSWNCGSGDFIVQPVASASNVRKLERVHAAVMGAHRRSHCLLPLEMYLEEGIPLVCYVRDGLHAEMVELPEQSCHAFLSFSNAAAEPPSLKVSCNDWHLQSEVSSAYLLEKLVYSMQEAGVEGGGAPDGADSWVASPYAALQPCTIQGPNDPRLKGTWQRPWADEMEDQFCSPHDIRSQADPANRSSRMEVLLVRSVEKALDAVNGLLEPTSWSAMLSTDDGLRVLQDALPVVLDLQLRAIDQPISRSRRALKVPGIGDDSGAHFSREYMTQLVLEVQQALATAEMDGAARQAEGLLLSHSPEPAPAEQAVPEGSAAETSCSVDILASTSSSTLDTPPAPAPVSRRPHLSRCQRLQAQEGVATAATGQPHSSSEGSAQHSGAASQGSACASHRVSLGAAGSQAKGSLLHLAAQVCQQNVDQSMGCRGTKRSREGNNEAVLGQSPGKRLCRFSSEMLQVVRSDQVFSVFMHLQYAAKDTADAQADAGQHSARLQEMCAAAEAVTEAELLQLGLPVLRSHWLLAMQQEWQASQIAATQFAQLGKARQRRCWLEDLHEIACSNLIQTNAKAWGAPPSK